MVSTFWKIVVGALLLPDALSAATAFRIEPHNAATHIHRRADVPNPFQKGSPYSYKPDGIDPDLKIQAYGVFSTGHQDAIVPVDKFAYDLNAGRMYLLHALNRWDDAPARKPLHELMMGAWVHEAKQPLEEMKSVEYIRVSSDVIEKAVNAAYKIMGRNPEEPGTLEVSESINKEAFAKLRDMSNGSPFGLKYMLGKYLPSRKVRAYLITTHGDEEVSKEAGASEDESSDDATLGDTKRPLDLAVFF
ncbi:Uu.00g090870.m01.CDS01 [Anthostomella pinea]|uniref:Uu.00g090870.m01.CDS01 n=1 Tax=Anthostomella pinea TaxID=933095 RepID=A0AAI8VNX5_9PEZI|nr:Uu.00g090870.m01.CDS01 [Anthostomella pinea]